MSLLQAKAWYKVSPLRSTSERGWLTSQRQAKGEKTTRERESRQDIVDDSYLNRSVVLPYDRNAYTILRLVGLCIYRCLPRMCVT